MLPAPINDPDRIAEGVAQQWREDTRHPDGSVNVLGAIAVIGAMCLALVILVIARVIYAIGDALGFNR